jgi:RimJ/RimL family protein N-acetyltransferase
MLITELLAPLGRLVGEYATLRLLAVEDAARTFRWRQSSRAGLLNRGAETVDEQERWIKSRPLDEVNFVIEIANGDPVGMLSLVQIDRRHRRAEPGRFLIGEPEAVRGIPVAVEAMLLLYEFAFGPLGMQRLFGTVVEGNDGMLKWQKYLGMTEEGRLRRHYHIEDRWRDAIVLGMLKEDFEKVARPKMRALISAGRRQMNGKE